MSEIQALFELESQTPINANFELEENSGMDVVFEMDMAPKNHNELFGRDAPSCHPISAITGLQEALDNAGQVKDVEVDGQSVVNQDGVAEIDLTGKQDVIPDLDEIRAGAALGETAVQPSELSAVATSGNYNDLTNKPTIGNATLTVQKNGTAVDTFTANATSDKTINITVPTQPSDIGAATAAQGALADSALQPSDVVNNTTSTATNAPLSANMGKSLQEQVDNLKARGRYLALWNCATGLAQSNPPQTTYEYKAGDYFIVGTVANAGGTNYRPTGSNYTTGVASTVVETADVAVNDVYYYDGTNWSLQINTQKEVAFVNIAGDPYDNTNLASALNNKVTGNNAITGATKCKITYDSKGLVTAGADLSTSDIPDLSATYATSAQGSKADTAVQDVKVNNVSVVDNNNVANILAPCVYRDWT